LTAAADGFVTDRSIGDYALLSDRHSAALVSGAGSIDWLCLPRFDAPSVFGRLLDADSGHWSLRPSGEYESRRRYLPGTLVLETQYTTPTGMAMLTEALAFEDHEREHEIGNASPHVLLRVLEVTDGEVPIDGAFAPRPEYGLIEPRLQVFDEGVVAIGGANLLMLSGRAPTATDGATALWRVGLRQGESLSFALQHQADWSSFPEPWPAKRTTDRLADTIKAWQSWSALHDQYTGPWQEQVHHSGRVLQGLTFPRTSAVVAAPTTSLPEQEGGSRNWDYRYCWRRDSGRTTQALWVAACRVEAGRFVSFITRSASRSVQQEARVQIVSGVGGEHDLSERELPHMTGWRGSRPVRVGNAMWNQVQHDSYGAVLDAVYRFREQIAEFESGTVEFLVGLADAAADVWREPDQGMWEIRGDARHYVHSKLMCWVALDRATQLAEQLGVEERATGWAEAAEEVRAAILDEGWNEHVGAFTQTFGGDLLDASSLMLATTGFLPATDPRMRATIDTIATKLSAPCGLLYRYRDDGLPGGECTFLLCNFWLAECWALAGELDAARETFGRTTAYANDVGLLSEQADPSTGELLGNFPQAFSHIGLINAAWAIAQAENGGAVDAGS
jgi:GH15 family glucan-1,4-alpha-glucosidase